MGYVIKSHGHVVPAKVMDARATAAALVAEGRRQADALRAAAVGERERALREAREVGYAEGRARAAFEVAGVLAAARAEAAAAVARAGAEALDVAAAMAERIVGRAVALDRDVMAEIAGEALAACQTRRGGVVLRVHSSCLEDVERHRDALAARLGEGAALEVVGDDEIEPPGCVVDTAVGRVDARLPSLLAALTSSLAGEGGA
jgi:flagellar biosynthesis/type III secretory pathway protein FliH